jgi:hypothetical protein
MVGLGKFDVVRKALEGCLNEPTIKRRPEQRFELRKISELRSEVDGDRRTEIVK